MTEEQMADLFLQIERLHPVDEKETIRDPDFDVEQEAEERKGILWDDVKVVSFGEAAAPPPAPPDAEEWEELTPWGWDKLAGEA